MKGKEMMHLSLVWIVKSEERKGRGGIIKVFVWLRCGKERVHYNKLILLYPFKYYFFVNSVFGFEINY